MNQPIVIKFGGEIVENPHELQNLLSSVRLLHQQGESLILVHGGGPGATKLSQRLGIETRMHEGRRITSDATIEVMKMALPGIMNSNILAAMRSKNLPGVAANAITFVQATRRPPRQNIDYGLVGDIQSVDPALLHLLLDHHLIPVVAPLCADSAGTILNVNADTVAAHLTKATLAKRLVMVTSVGGVYLDLKNRDTKLSTLTTQQAQELIANGAIHSGMIPKIEEGLALLAQHLDTYHIVGVGQTDELLAEMERPGSRGTVIVK